MVHTARSRAPDWHPASPQARWLATCVRSTRLTLAAGAPESVTELLAAGVLPLLGRRSDDAGAKDNADREGHSPNVVPFADRRRAREGWGSEILVLLDASRERTLELLAERLDTSVRSAGRLPEFGGWGTVQRTAALHQRHGCSFRILIDRFDTLLYPGVATHAVRALIEELIALLNEVPSVNVLLGVRADAVLLLQPFFDCLHGFSPLIVDVTRDAATPERGDAAIGSKVTD